MFVIKRKEFEKLLDKLNLSIEMLNWCDRICVGAFCGVSQYAIIMPESDLLIGVSRGVIHKC